MESKQDYQINRIIFIKEFTDEIIFNLAEDFKLKRKINAEKIKQKFLKNKTQEQPEGFNSIVNHKILHPVKYPKAELRKIPQPRIPIKPSLKKPMQKNYQELGQLPSPIELEEKQVIESIKPEYYPKPQGFNLGKLEPLLQDQMIQTIECPGPGKNILVNRYGKINITKIVLSKEDIDEIIKSFSTFAQIPLVEGILKAVVGNMMISAVTSEIVGSRFIINKIYPSYNIQQR